MGFKISFERTTKNSIPVTPQLPEIFGTQTFCTLETTQQDSTALISMYNDLPEIQAPVNYIIDSLSTIPYYHYRNDKIVSDSKIMEVVKNPNQYQTANDFIKLALLNRIVLGSLYVNRIKSIGGRNVNQMYVLPSQNTVPVLEDINQKDFRLNNIVGYESTVNGYTIKLNKDEVLTQLEASLIQENHYKSRSRLMSAIMTSDSLRNNYEARIKLLKDRGSVGIISPRDNNSTITPDAAESMRAKYYQQNGITGNKFPFLISPRSLDFTSTTMNAGELELLPSQEKGFTTVCNVLGIDPALFGIGNNTYNNKKLASTAFWENVGIPYLNNYLQLLVNVFNLPKNETIKADYTQVAAMQEDYENIVNANSKLWNDGVITEREYREATGYDSGEERKKDNTKTSEGTKKE